MSPAIEYPTEQEIREEAYAIWERRGGHGFDEFDWGLAERKLFINKNYHLVTLEKLVQDRKKRLGRSEQPVCRYCSKTRDDGVSFRVNQSHAVPRSLGNQALFSYDECSECNNLFSDYESSFNHSIQLIRALFRIRGYKLVKHVTKDGIRVEPSAEKVKIIFGNPVTLSTDAKEDGVFLTIDHANKRVIFEDSDSLITCPVKNFKLLCKIALAVIPDEYLTYFEHTIKWIRNTDHSVKPKGCEKLGAFFTTVDGCHLAHAGDVSVYLRKEEVNLPGALFQLRMQKMAFQIAIPLCEADHFITEVNVPYIPPFIDFTQDHGPPVWATFPMDEHENVPVLNRVEGTFKKMKVELKPIGIKTNEVYNK